MNRILFVFIAAFALAGGCAYSGRVAARPGNLQPADEVRHAIAAAVQDPARAARMQTLAEKIDRQLDALLRVKEEYLRQMYAENTDYDARLDDFENIDTRSGDRRARIDRDFIAAFMEMRNTATKKEWQEIADSVNDLITGTFDEASALGGPLALQNKEEGLRALQQRVKLFVSDPGKKWYVMQATSDIAMRLQDFKFALTVDKEALAVTVRQYDGSKDDLERVLSTLEDLRDETQTRITYSRFKMKDNMSRDEWGLVFPKTDNPPA